jgi:FlaA1/EpsC-like NDP-sugar epimerase
MALVILSVDIILKILGGTIVINQLKNSFFQVFTITSLWVTLLLTIFFRDQSMDMVFLWRIAGIAVISAGIFGVMYSALWNYFTFKPIWNILISSTFSILGGMGMIWLFSVDMFYFISPWLPGMLLLSVVLHFIAFYFYAGFNSKKNAEELNKILR